GGQLAQPPGADGRDDVRADQAPALVDGCGCVAAEPEVQPALHGVGHGVVVRGDAQPVVKVAHHLLELRFGLGLGLRAGLAGDPLAPAVIADSDLRYPAPARLAPVQAALAAAASPRHGSPINADTGTPEAIPRCRRPRSW